MTEMKRVTGIVEATGEEVTVLIDHTPGRSKQTAVDRYATVYDNGWRAIRDGNLTPTDVRVLAVVVMRAMIAARFETDPGGIAIELGIDVRRVYNSLARLEGLGFVTRPKKGFLKLNPKLIWKGSHKERMTELGMVES